MMLVVLLAEGFGGIASRRDLFQWVELAGAAVVGIQFA